MGRFGRKPSCVEVLVDKRTQNRSETRTEGEGKVKTTSRHKKNVFGRRKQKTNEKREPSPLIRRRRSRSLINRGGSPSTVPRPVAESRKGLLEKTVPRKRGSREDRGGKGCRVKNPMAP